MDTSGLLECLELKDDAVFDDGIDAISPGNGELVVNQVHHHIDLETKSASGEFMGQARRVRRLETSGSDSTVHGHAAPDDTVRDLVLCLFGSHALPVEHGACRSQRHVNRPRTLGGSQLPRRSHALDNAGSGTGRDGRDVPSAFAPSRLCVRQAAEDYSRKAATNAKVSWADTSFRPLRLRAFA